MKITLRWGLLILGAVAPFVVALIMFLVSFLRHSVVWIGLWMALLILMGVMVFTPSQVINLFSLFKRVRGKTDSERLSDLLNPFSFVYFRMLVVSIMWLLTVSTVSFSTYYFDSMSDDLWIGAFSLAGVVILFSLMFRWDLTHRKERLNWDRVWYLLDNFLHPERKTIIESRLDDIGKS